MTFVYPNCTECRISGNLLSSLLADRGFASGAFFLGGGVGKKGVMLRGLRISEKKEILRKLTVQTFVLIYLLYQQQTSRK